MAREKERDIETGEDSDPQNMTNEPHNMNIEPTKCEHHNMISDFTVCEPRNRTV